MNPLHPTTFFNLLHSSFLSHQSPLYRIIFLPVPFHHKSFSYYHFPSFHFLNRLVFHCWSSEDQSVSGLLSPITTPRLSSSAVCRLQYLMWSSYPSINLPPPPCLQLTAPCCLGFFFSFNHSPHCLSPSTSSSLSLFFFPGTTSLFFSAESVSGHPHWDDEGKNNSRKRKGGWINLSEWEENRGLCCIDGPGDNLAWKQRDVGLKQSSMTSPPPFLSLYKSAHAYIHTKPFDFSFPGLSLIHCDKMVPISAPRRHTRSCKCQLWAKYFQACCLCSILTATSIQHAGKLHKKANKHTQGWETQMHFAPRDLPCVWSRGMGEKREEGGWQRSIPWGDGRVGRTEGGRERCRCLSFYNKNTIGTNTARHRLFEAPLCWTQTVWGSSLLAVGASSGRLDLHNRPLSLVLHVIVLSLPLQVSMVERDRVAQFQPVQQHPKLFSVPPFFPRWRFVFLGGVYLNLGSYAVQIVNPLWGKLRVVILVGYIKNNWLDLTWQTGSCFMMEVCVRWYEHFSFFFKQTYLASAWRLHFQLTCQLWKAQEKDKKTKAVKKTWI